VKVFDFNKQKANRLHEEAERLDEDGRVDQAIAKYLEAIRCDPKKTESHYNLGLIYKYQGEWQRSFECNRKANESDPEHEAARWNLAIAATALRNWTVARRKWEENGITLDGREGPIEIDLGMTPVRLNPDGNGEVVWATRIDPARARIDSIPFPESGFHHGDVVLNDGAPLGYRTWGEREYPVFNVLELFERSPYTTCVATVAVESPSDLAALADAFADTRSRFEDWTDSVRIMCRACSEGRPHEQHDHESKQEWSLERRLGIAVFPGEDVLRILERWQNESGGRLLSIDPGFLP
jgi:tetratricopeptide (TPR) repeat protein